MLAMQQHQVIIVCGETGSGKTTQLPKIALALGRGKCNAPEGTRGKAGGWKTGFYNIALKAGVPMVPGFMDYERKVVGLGPAMTPSGDYEKDLAVLAAFYAPVTPKHPELKTIL